MPAKNDLVRPDREWSRERVDLDLETGEFLDPNRFETGVIHGSGDGMFGDGIDKRLSRLNLTSATAQLTVTASPQGDKSGSPLPKGWTLLFEVRPFTATQVDFECSTSDVE
jgi:hypothetical protein